MTTRSLHKQEELQEGTSHLGATVVKWKIQLYKPDRKGEKWEPTGNVLEWLATHPYIALARAIVGEAKRPSLRLAPNQIVHITDGYVNVWLSPADVLMIADEVEAIGEELIRFQVVKGAN